MSKSSIATRAKGSVSLVVLFALFFTFATNAGAACYLCSAPGVCFLWHGSCNEAANTGFICFTAGALAKQPGTYVLSSGKGAWVIEPSKKTPIASDQMADFRTKLEAKYAKAKPGDPATAKLIAADWAAFFKTPQNPAVSPARLKEIATETGLAVRSEAIPMSR